MRLKEALVIGSIPATIAAGCHPGLVNKRPINNLSPTSVEVSLPGLDGMIRDTHAKTAGVLAGEIEKDIDRTLLRSLDTRTLLRMAQRSLKQAGLQLRARTQKPPMTVDQFHDICIPRRVLARIREEGLTATQRKALLKCFTGLAVDQEMDDVVTRAIGSQFNPVFRPE